ncbi:hypothetical protein MKX03_034306 [Papaver bracteatum]|nr:hypothetical protein MKX03_034306 [Papaver bracteatum]
MKSSSSALRNGVITFFHSLNPNPNSYKTIPFRKFISINKSSLPSLPTSDPQKFRFFCSSMAQSGDSVYSSSSVEKQFEGFRSTLEDSGKLRERIKAVAGEIESAARFMHSGLLLVHQSRPVPEVLERAKAQIQVLKELYSKLAEILTECPGQYYRFHGEWRSETQTAVSLIVLLHWLETGDLLMHKETEAKLGLGSSEFGLDIEDYLTGVCFMSNELPRYVVNQVTAGDYDCPRKVLNFLTELHAAFRMLNLRNDLLRRKFDGMKYDLRKVEEVYYDVKIRGLTANGDPGVQG